MLINIVTPHISNLLAGILASFWRCLDRGCRCDKRKTKKVIQEDYENLYKGPQFLLEFRYSQLITVVFVIMMYSTGIPMLYMIAVVNFFITYWVDKFLCKHSYIHT